MARQGICGLQELVLQQEFQWPQDPAPHGWRCFQLGVCRNWLPGHQGNVALKDVHLCVIVVHRNRMHVQNSYEAMRALCSETNSRKGMREKGDIS